MRSKTFRVLRISIVLLALLGVAGGAATGPRPAAAADTPPISAMGGPHRISISASAFRPWKDGQLYENHGRYLKHLGGLSGLNYYYAPVYLPHGATVTKMTFYFLDNMPGAGDNIKASLMRTNLASIRGTMASVDSAGSSGYSSKSDDTIVNPTVDNSQYTYLLRWEMIPPVSDSEYAWGCGMVIEYTDPATTPSPNYLSLPPAAFQPFLDGNDYENFEHQLQHIHSPGGGTDNSAYIAPVHLPHGATVTKMTFYYYGYTSYAGGSYLQRTEYGQGDFQSMAEVIIPWSNPQYSHQADSTIVNPTVDNSRYGYWVVWDLPPSARPGTSYLFGSGVVIEYTNPPMSALAGYISLPAAAFMPDTNSYDYENHARYLVQRNAPGVYGKYLAPIQLPDDATITRMTFHYRRNTDSATEPTSELHWTGLAGNYGIMASVGTSGGWTSPWYTSKSDATITNAQVDNAGYGYHAVWKNMPDTTFNPDGTPQLMVWGCGVVIEYGYRLYLPLTLRSYH